jgi:hypothetical protein
MMFTAFDNNRRKFPEMIGCIPRDRCDSAHLLDYSV